MFALFNSFSFSSNNSRCSNNTRNDNNNNSSKKEFTGLVTNPVHCTDTQNNGGKALEELWEALAAFMTNKGQSQIRHDGLRSNNGRLLFRD